MTYEFSGRENDFIHLEDTGDERLSEEATMEQLDCYQRLLHPLDRQSIVADIACGDGRHTLPMAESYGAVVGVDIDEGLLQRAKDLGTSVGNAHFVEGDMRQLPFGADSFDGVLNGFSSWGFYGPTGDVPALREMSRVLKPGGVLVLDYGNIDTRLREIEEHGSYHEQLKQQVVYDTFVAPDQREVLRTSWVDADLNYHWICQKAGDSNPLVVGVQKGYRANELTQMFHEAGLDSVEMYGDYNLAPVDDQHKRLIIRATKQSV
jgi:ubiquinone/menaquinone biosynthesis C-methylase UbiE